MSISSLSKRALFALGVAPLLLVGVARAAGPITSMTITTSGSGVFTAGVTTNTPTTTIFINTFAAALTTPDAGEVVRLELLDGTDVIANGMSPSSFTTTGSGIVNGGNLPLPITFFRAGTGTIRIRATSQTNGVVATGPAFTVNPGAANRLLLVGPGMTHVPGTDPSVTTGLSGTFAPQEANQPFTVTVILTDVAFNRVPLNHSVSFAASADFVSVPPGSNPLGATGQQDFNVTITAPRVDRSITASDDTNPSVAAGTLAMTTAGPAEKEIFPFPSPFNPRQQNITFRFRLSSPASAKIIVTDLFGQKVWSQSVSGGSGFNDVVWNGRNDEGAVIASGVYYALLEVDGSFESRKRFGVVK